VSLARIDRSVSTMNPGGSPRSAARILSTSAHRARSLRWGVGIVACVVLPAASWLGGSPTFAWTMYSRAGEFRIDFVTTGADGHRRSRNPTALAENASAGTASMLGGADHWRQGPSTATLRTHLDDLADHACRETGAVAVELTLHERIVGGPDRATTCRRACTP
jgi:hypothetical protein